MSSKSMDPISRRESTAVTNQQDKVVSEVKTAPSNNAILARAEAQLREKKQRQATKRTKRIGFAAVAVLVVFIIGAVLLIRNDFSQQAQQKEQEKKSAQEESLDTLKSWRSVKVLGDDEEVQFLKAVGPSYIAADLSGFGLSEAEREQISKLLGPGANKDQLGAAITTRINRKLELAKTTGYFEGYLFYFWFGNSIVNKLPEVQITGWNDPAVLQADKEYAMAKANEYRAKIQDGTISPTDLLSTLQADKRLKLYDEANGSTYFTTSLFRTPIEDDGRYKSVDNVLNRQTAAGVTEINTIVADPGLPVSGNKREVGYFFLKLDKVLKGQEAIDKYEEQLELAKGLTL